MASLNEYGVSRMLNTWQTLRWDEHLEALVDLKLLQYARQQHVVAQGAQFISRFFLVGKVSGMRARSNSENCKTAKQKKNQQIPGIQHE